MTVYVIVQLKMTDRAACDRYQKNAKDRKAGVQAIVLLVKGFTPNA